MMNEKRVMRMEQIKEWAEEWGLSMKEAVYELSTKSEAELIEIFCRI